MPDSNITKTALACALKELMKEAPFLKISVGDICAKCGMNRKSFYYHFKDKYDLVNWIYYTEFVEVVSQKTYRAGWDLIEDICTYFYRNRDFYRKVLKIKEQNSFEEYFRELLSPVIGEYFEEIFSDREMKSFYVDFFEDAFCSAITRWLSNKDCIPADRFLSLLKDCICGTAQKVVKEMSGGTGDKEISL